MNDVLQWHCYVVSQIGNYLPNYTASSGRRIYSWMTYYNGTAM